MAAFIPIQILQRPKIYTNTSQIQQKISQPIFQLRKFIPTEFMNPKIIPTIANTINSHSTVIKNQTFTISKHSPITCILPDAKHPCLPIFFVYENIDKYMMSSNFILPKSVISYDTTKIFIPISEMGFSQPYFLPIPLRQDLLPQIFIPILLVVSAILCSLAGK